MVGKRNASKPAQGKKERERERERKRGKERGKKGEESIFKVPLRVKGMLIINFAQR